MKQKRERKEVKEWNKTFEKEKSIKVIMFETFIYMRNICMYKRNSQEFFQTFDLKPCREL